MSSNLKKMLAVPVIVAGLGLSLSACSQQASADGSSVQRAEAAASRVEAAAQRAEAAAQRAEQAAQRAEMAAQKAEAVFSKTVRK